MRDAEQQYPHQQPGGNGSRQQFDDETEVEFDDRDDFQGLNGPQLPHNRFTKALIIGIAAGLLCAIQSVVITLVNSSAYQTYVTSGTQQSVQDAVAFTLFGLACLTFGISMLICFVAGYVTGKVAVLRKMGFLTGFIAGAIIYTLSFLLNYIPGYPTHLASSGVHGLVGVGSGILVSLIFLLVWGVIGGLASLAGAWFATRKHPYYYASQGS
jgi:hypothetical protein